MLLKPIQTPHIDVFHYLCLVPNREQTRDIGYLRKRSGSKVGRSLPTVEAKMLGALEIPLFRVRGSIRLHLVQTVLVHDEGKGDASGHDDEVGIRWECRKKRLTRLDLTR